MMFHMITFNTVLVHYLSPVAQTEMCFYGNNMMTNCRGKGLAAAGGSEEISTEKPREMALGSNS